jgi:ABC-type Na+ efflux pump permease subunit
MNACEITRKDLLLLYRDRRTLSVLVALPLAFISILGFSTGQLFSNGQKARTIRVAVVDADDSELSAKIVSELKGLKAIEVKEFADRSAARKELAEDQTDVLLYIGPGYDEKIGELELYDLFHVDEGRLKEKLKTLDIQVESGSFLANASEIVHELVFSFSLRTMAPAVLKKYPKIATQIVKASRESQESLERELEAATNLPDRPQTGPNIVYQILVPSYTVMFVFFIVNFMARSFIGERDMGTLNRLRLAPITRPGLMIGKTVPFLVISLVQTTLLFLAGKLLFSDAKVDAHTGQVTLRGEFPNPKRELLPGMYVRVLIEQGIDSDAIAVPQQAIQRNGGGGSEVFVVTGDNRAVIQPVRTGSLQGGQWFVTEGLKAGDRVVVEGFQKFAAGDRVRPQIWTEADASADFAAGVRPTAQR